MCFALRTSSLWACRREEAAVKVQNGEGMRRWWLWGCRLKKAWGEGGYEGAGWRRHEEEAAVRVQAREGMRRRQLWGCRPEDIWQRSRGACLHYYPFSKKVNTFTQYIIPGLARSRNNASLQFPALYLHLLIAWFPTCSVSHLCRLVFWQMYPTQAKTKGISVPQNILSSILLVLFVARELILFL